MKKSVVNEQYLQLQINLHQLQEKWYARLKDIEITNREMIATMNQPILLQLDLKIDLQEFKQSIMDTYELISMEKEDLKKETNKVIALLDEKTLHDWFKNALSVNTYYFEKFARDNNLLEWILFFAAELATRPILQKVVSDTDMCINNNHQKLCPCCGEPPRFGVINKEGKKELYCPRCTFKWSVKMIQCAYCGDEKQKVLRVENDDSAEVQACPTCNQYTKIIDTRKLLRVEAPAILDIKYIHLDYIAQKRGFGVMKEEITH